MNRDDEVFSEALDLSPEDRAAYLDRIGMEDPALRDRVVALLAGLAAADRFLQESPVNRPPPTPEEQLGDKIDRYTLLRKLGEGGCGVVYLAEQTEPVRRKVALKVIKLGMDTLNVIARFEAERQALAMMDHPDIARVFDAGSTGMGRPYFVMEFVDGVPITQFCDQHQLTMGARLELFAQVCAGLQHAHQKGIIHRDIKPSNVLVSMRDEKPAPKIIDFGIAKATQGRLTEHTLETCLNQFIGTPAYMSPEQAELRELDVDTRSDVYSLGVLLYELLAGRPPYDPKSLQQAGIDEIRRIIREIDPPRPSAAVSTLTNADRSTIASHRRAVPTRLTSVLEGDLDWIVMRCLEKQRDRRYGTASELAEDVRRHLRNEPVQARPPHPLYKLRKFVVRNRLACASGLAVVASMVIGTVVATTQAIRATRAERVAVAARDDEAIAREDAQRRQEQAEELLTFMIGDFRAGLAKLGRLELLDTVGAKAMDYFGSLDVRDLTDTALTRQAKALTQIGEVRMDQASFEDADSSFRSAYQRASALSNRYPDNADMLFERAQAEFWIGFVARRRGAFAAEREWMTHYRDSALALAALEGPTLRAQHELIFGHHNLAVLDFDNGDYQAARIGFEAEHLTITRLIETHPDDPTLKRGLIDVVSWLGTVEEREGNYATALRWFEEMAKNTAAAVSSDPENSRWQLRHAQALTFIGDTHTDGGDFVAAREYYVGAKRLFDTLVERDDENRGWLVSLLSLQLQLVALDLFEANYEAVESALPSVREGLELLVATEPSSRKFRGHLVAALRMSALLDWLAQGDSQSAEATIKEAIAIVDPLVEGDVVRVEREILGEFARTHLLAGRLARRHGEESGANVHWQRIITVLRPLLEQSHDWRVLEPAANALRLTEDVSSSNPLFERLAQHGYRSIAPLASSTSEGADSNP